MNKLRELQYIESELEDALYGTVRQMTIEHLYRTMLRLMKILITKYE